MQFSRYIKIFSLFILIFSSNISSNAQDTVKIMYYNILTYSPTSNDKIQYLQQITSYTKPDVLCVTEIDDDTSASHILNYVLNINGQTNYQKAAFTDGTDTDNMIFFNSEFFSLHFQDTIQTTLRLINRYKLFYKNSLAISSDSVFLDFYVGHLKASSGSTNEIRRYQEVKLMKNYIETETPGTNVFFGGDMNFYGSNEPALKLLLDSGDVRFNDPIDSIGEWQDNIQYAKIHTQSTRTRQFGGGASGGLDDRFDFIFATNDIISGSNLVKYIANTYEAFGNDGNHLNDSLTAFPLNPAIPDSITYALYGMADHLPVLMKVVIADASSINENESTNSVFQILPNPANGSFNIMLNSNVKQNIEIRISDINGKVLIQDKKYSQKGSENYQYQIKNKGIYFVTIRTNQKSTTKKLVIE